MKAAVPRQVDSENSVGAVRAPRPHLSDDPRVVASLLEDSADVILLVDRGGIIIFASDSVRLVDGYASTALLGCHVLDRVHPHDVAPMRRQFAACVQKDGGRCDGFEYRQQHRDGTWRDREAIAVNRLSEPGISAIVVTYRDVTDRKAAEAQRAHLAAIVESSDDAIYSRTLEGELLSWNGGAERLTGYTAAEAVGQHVSLILGPESRAELPMVLQRIRDGESIRRELTWVRKDGSSVVVSITASPTRDSDGCIAGVSTVARDVTERLRVETALTHSEARHRSTFDDAPVGMAQTSLEGRWLRVNRRLASMLGYSQQEMLSTDFATLTHLDDVEDNLTGRTNLLAGRIDEYRREKRYRRRDGSLVWVNLTVSLQRGVDGTPQHFIAVMEDISDRKQAQFQLDQIFNLSPDMIATAGLDGYFTRLNPAWRQVLGYSEETLLGRPFIDFVHPDDRATTLEAVSQLGAGKSVFGFTNRYLAADGSYRLLEWHSKVDLATGVIYAVARDQTDRRLLEEQFRQSQKMEAVGRLAGGVAHDFNNLLTAIIGFAEIALGQLPEDAPVRDDIVQVIHAGRSAALLTRQLLAFSRKQILQPQVLDVAELIGDMRSLLRRVIGEDVTLDVSTGGGVPRICVDRGQVEQVVMNLAVNARDAMPTGGTLQIMIDVVELDEAFRTQHAGANTGAHVRLTIADTGVGMGPDVLARVFEPFFSTKEPGKGTGLGLATVYGIVKQSGGYISVESAPGQGTSFQVHFPCTPAGITPGITPEIAPTSLNGTETILVVEDQDEVRAAVRQTLESSGYRVLEAADGPSALELLPLAGRRVHLLLTDVVMPRMSGRELAARAVAIEGDLRVLYMSGYTDDVVVRHGVLEPGIEFVQKPFTQAELKARVRAVLDCPMSPGGRCDRRAYPPPSPVDHVNLSPSMEGAVPDAGNRQSPRIEVSGTVHVETDPPTGRLTLIDVSWGGFLVSSADPFPDGALLTFCFSSPGSVWKARLAASVVHSHLRTMPAVRPPEHVTGFKFIGTDNVAVNAIVDALMEHAMGNVEVYPVGVLPGHDQDAE